MSVAKGLSSCLLVVLCLSSIAVSGRTYQTQPLIFALKNYYGQSANAYNKVAASLPKIERSVEEEEEEYEDDEYEYEDEEYAYEPPRIVFKPLIVVLMEGLMATGSRLRPAARAESSEEEEGETEEEEEETAASSSMFKDALSLPFKLLQQYGMSTLSTYFPVLEQLKSYGQFYDNLSRASNSAAAVQLKEEVEDMAEALKEEARNDPVNERKRFTYETFSRYFPYAIVTLKLGSYFVPGLGQVKTALVGLEIVRISWKTAHMYNKGDSVYEILHGLGKEFVTAAIGRRAELEPLTTPSTQTAFVDISSMDVDTFLALVKESKYPPLNDKDEATLQEDVTNVVESYFGNEGITAEQKTQIIATIEMVAKFIALHAIIPALTKSSGGTNS